MKSDFHIQGSVRVEYRVQTRSLARQHLETTALITAEHRVVGGVALVALALTALGARVRLSADPIGNDSHGRFLLSQLQVPGLELDMEVREDVATPYAILIRDETGSVQTLLSPDAASSGQGQDYASLLESLRAPLMRWLNDADKVAALIAAYDESFGQFRFENV